MRRFFPGQRLALVTAFASLFSMTGCLKINPDYTSLPRGEDAVQNTTADFNDASKSSASDQASSSGPQTIPSIDQDATTGQDLETSASTSDLTTPGSSQATSNPSTTSEDPTSSGLGPVPSSWKPVTISAQLTDKDVPSGYTFDLDIDHAAMVANGAANDGSDLSIVLRRNDTLRSLNRVLDIDSRWNRVNTKIWFAIDGDIARGSILSDQYYLVVGDATLLPVSDPTTLFLTYDNFEDPVLDTLRWSTWNSLAGSPSISQINEGQRLSARTPSTQSPSHYTIRHVPRTYPDGIRVEVRSRYNFFDMLGTCGRVFPIALKSQIDGLIRTSLRINLSDYDVVAYDDTQLTEVVTPVDNEFPQDGPWNIHTLTWLETEVRYDRDGTELIRSTNPGAISVPNQVPLQLELSAGLARNGCFGSGRVDLDIDWVRVRPYMLPSPSARIE